MEFGGSMVYRFQLREAGSTVLGKNPSWRRVFI